MFYKCSSITDIKSLENWNVSNGTNFHMMFSHCNFSDLRPLNNWNVAKGEQFDKMFGGCKLLKNKNILKNWKLPENIDFNSIFME